MKTCDGYHVFITTRRRMFFISSDPGNFSIEAMWPIPFMIMAIDT